MNKKNTKKFVKRMIDNYSYSDVEEIADWEED